MRRAMVLVVGAPLLLGACTDMNSSQQSTLSGGALGAAGGAVLGAIGGNALLGTVVGAGAGAAGGYLYNHVQQNRRRAYDEGYYQGREER
jgi:osmotically inducible lipoprotein OsmB